MQTFTLTPAQFETRLNQVKAETGQTALGMSGTIQHEGVDVTYSYSAVTEKLAVDVTHAPGGIVGRMLAEKRIREWFGQPE